MFRKIIVISIFTMFLGYSYSYNDICVDGKCLGNELYDGIKYGLEGDLDRAKAITKKKIVENFCKTIYKFPNLPDKSKTSFKTNESIFLNILCSSIGEDKGKPKFNIKGKKMKYYTSLLEEAESASNTGSSGGGKNTIFTKCKKENGIITDKESLNNVDFTCFANDLFNNISSDIINMSTFIAFGGYGSEETRKKWEKDFFAGKDSPCKDSFLKSDDEDKHYCQHPETAKYMEEVSNQLKPMIKHLNLIEVEPDEIYEKMAINKKEDNPGAILMNIKDMAYSEQYYYNLFLSYYSSAIKQYNTSISLKKISGEVEDINNLNGDDEIIKSKQYIETSKHNIEKSFDAIKNIYRTYPIHIGFLSIIEDLNRLRKSIASLYTPLDQLRYKMEQAQDEDKK